MSISYKGYGTGFPFPITHTDSFTMDEGYWIGFTIEQFAEFFWRVREMSFSAGITATSLSGFIDFVVDTSTAYSGPEIKAQTQKDPLAAVENITSEALLVTPIDDNSTTAVFIEEDFGDFGLGASGWSPVGTYEAYTGPPSTTGDLWGEFYMRVEFSETIFSGGLFYPKITFMAIFAADTTFGGIPTSVVVANQTVGGPTIPVTICGATGYLEVGNGAPTPTGSPVDSATGSITIAPTSYWGYGGKWNPATGTPT